MKKRIIFGLTLLFLAGIVLFSGAGCGKKEEAAKQIEVKTQDNSSLKISTSVKKGVELPPDYPKDKFPVYKDALILSVQTLDKSYVLACYSKDSVQKVGGFYKDFFKNSQIIAQTEQADEYTVMGIKDGYTYTFSIAKNNEQDKELKDYPTVMAISLVPGAQGMPEGLKGMTGNTKK